MRRIIVGGIVAGLVLFAWSFVAHDLLPSGTAGLRTIPPAQEEAVISSLRSGLNEHAIYLFPGFDLSGNTNAEQQRGWKDRYEAGPAGVIVFNPHPAERVSADALFAQVFATELICDVLAGLLAAVLISQLPAGAGVLRRALFVGSLGLLMTLDVDVSYWNWYAFPVSYTLAQLVDHGVGYLLAGVVLARVVNK